MLETQNVHEGVPVVASPMVTPVVSEMPAVLAAGAPETLTDFIDSLRGCPL